MREKAVLSKSYWNLEIKLGQSYNCFNLGKNAIHCDLF